MLHTELIKKMVFSNIVLIKQSGGRTSLALFRSRKKKWGAKSHFISLPKI